MLLSAFRSHRRTWFQQLTADSNFDTVEVRSSSLLVPTIHSKRLKVKIRHSLAACFPPILKIAFHSTSQECRLRSLRIRRLVLTRLRDTPPHPLAALCRHAG